MNLIITTRVYNTNIFNNNLNVQCSIIYLFLTVKKLRLTHTQVFDVFRDVTSLLRMRAILSGQRECTVTGGAICYRIRLQ